MAHMHFLVSTQFVDVEAAAGGSTTTVVLLPVLPRSPVAPV
jgi:hypothetical protein